MQGGVLAAAAILGRIIGLIYRIPLTNIIGDLGNNYYGCAFDIYNIFCLFRPIACRWQCPDWSLITGRKESPEMRTVY